MENDPMNRSHNTGFVTFDFARNDQQEELYTQRNAKEMDMENYNNLPTPDIIKKKKKLATGHRNLPGRIRFCHARIRCSLKDTTHVTSFAPMN